MKQTARKRPQTLKQDSTDRSTNLVAKQTKIPDKSTKLTGGSICNLVVRRVTLSLTILSVVYIYIYYKQWKEHGNYTTMASHEESIVGLPIMTETVCSNDYDIEKVKFESCIPRRCGRFVSDSIVTNQEALELRLLAETVFSISNPSGGVAIFDLSTGALSNGTQFINLFKLINYKENKIIKQKSLDTFKRVKNKIIDSISIQFGIHPQHLYLTSPAFFTRITNVKAQILNDEYWHSHVDKTTYGTFFYTSLLYLSTYQTEFTGGRFIFLDPKQNITVEPKFGRISAFTSGSENSHMVEKVSSGARFALTIPFTCDSQNAIKDPVLK